MADVPHRLVQTLLESRKKHQLPPHLRSQAHEFAQLTLGALFPQFSNANTCTDAAVTEELIRITEVLGSLERSIATISPEVPKQVVPAFLDGLAQVHASLTEDAHAIFSGDPAARSVDEVILTYPGFLAMAVYRVANLLHRQGLPLLPRLLTEYAHEKTGIDIHPGATIGKRFCIDHGTGIVIGETSHIGSNVKVYQGVTLGALTVEKEMAGTQRHPTIEDDVVIYAGATILGGKTVVGHHSIVAGNAWLTNSVPAYSVVSRRSEVRPRQVGGVEDIEFVI